MHILGTTLVLFIVFFTTYLICDRISNIFRTVKQRPKYKSALVGGIIFSIGFSIMQYLSTM
ncbi:hypothetical protein GTN30_06045 [Macrococcoides canis]|uniref:Uncharacterized protein n=1 Tax=Macrococcoides canis TaxID=1855823 RepID=A0AAE6X1W2_9STAP|nr:hypothetical protein [Macrococcus canis]QIH78227.1 hypothetical protein GTN30_06045 [Macrococcus canis]